MRILSGGWECTGVDGGGGGATTNSTKRSVEGKKYTVTALPPPSCHNESLIVHVFASEL